MNRRIFGKVVAGTVTATAISRVSKAESHAPQIVQPDVDSVGAASLSMTSDISPSGGSRAWEFVILDSVPPHATETGGTTGGIPMAMATRRW